MALISLSPVRFFQEAYLTVTDFHFYRTVCRQPFRRTLLYLLYLSAAVAIVLTLTYAWQYGPHFRKFSRWAQQHVPPLEVRDGKLIVEAEQPLIQTYDGEQPITVVFDTTGTYQGLATLGESSILLAEEEIYIRHQGETQIYRWRDLGPFRMGKEELYRLEIWCTRAYFPIVYSLLLVYTLVAKAIQAMVLVIFGLLASAREGVRLELGTYFTIGLYSLVPALIVDLG